MSGSVDGVLGTVVIWFFFMFLPMSDINEGSVECESIVTRLSWRSFSIASFS